MPRKRRPRVYGPEPHGRKFRIEIRDGGDRRYRSYETIEEAEARKAAYVKAFSQEAITVTEAIQRYETHLAEIGDRPQTVKTTRARLYKFFHQEMLVTEITPAKAKALYTRYRKTPTRTGRPPAVDTHRNTLGQVKTFMSWCVEQGWLRSNPFAKVKGLGRRKAGKEQLRIDEARELVKVCHREAEAGDVAAVAVIAAIYLGGRPTEIAQCQVRDVDDGGRILVIDRSKTKAGERSVEIPDDLAPLLRKLARRKPALAPLWGMPRTRHWVLYHTRRLCKLAGVPQVCAHSFRGLHSTAAKVAGATGHDVALMLGHASEVITDRHYTDRAQVAAANRKRAIRALKGGRR